MIIREATADAWPRIYPFFARIVADGRTYAYPPDLSLDEARSWWMEDAPGRTVVAVDGERDLLELRALHLHVAQEGRMLVGQRVADRVRKVDDRRTGLDHGPAHLGDERGVGASRVLARELDLVDAMRDEVETAQRACSTSLASSGFSKEPKFQRQSPWKKMRKKPALIADDNLFMIHER